MANNISQIASRLGLSRQAVSAVLSTPQSTIRVSKATRQRVLDAALAMGYRPNSAAKAISSGRFSAAGLVIRATEYDFLPFDLIRGVSDALASHDMHMNLARIPLQRIGDESVAPKLVRELSVDGLLIHEAVDIAPEITEMIRRHRIPAVWINAKASGDCVYPDDFEATNRAARQLVELGHRRVAYVDFAVDWGSAAELHYSIGDRRHGYGQAMLDAGLVPQVIRTSHRHCDAGPHVLPWGLPTDHRLEQAMNILRASDRPSAIIASDSDTAGPLLYAAARLGIEVPSGLSLVTIDTEPFATHGVPVSTLLIPMLQCGRDGVRMLMQKIDEPNRVLNPVAVRYPAMAGNTIVAAVVR